jgi:hypothetical protein
MRLVDLNFQDEKKAAHQEQPVCISKTKQFYCVI